jgi:Putative Zn-dependent protease, contains TPR repeats
MGIFDQNRNSRPPQSGRGRFFIALLIAIVGIVMYMNQVQENPITGEKQHVTMTPDQEIRLGLESAPAMAKEMGGEIPASDPRAQEVSRIGNLIIEKTEAKRSPWKFNFHLLADPKTVNAFALPGGQIFITLGLYNQLQNEAELAGVLSHEMGHVIERHSAQQMAKSQLGQMLIVAVATGASSEESSGRGPAMVAAMVNQMVQLKYSRGDESEADQWGINLMTKSGYDPHAMIQVMEVLKKAGGGRGHGPDFFQTHPNPDLRIEQIREHLKTHPPLPGLTEGNPIPKEKTRSLLWE